MSVEALGEMFVKLDGQITNSFTRMLDNAEKAAYRARDALLKMSNSAPGAFSKATAAVRGMTGSMGNKSFQRPRDELGRFVAMTKQVEAKSTGSFRRIGSAIATSVGGTASKAARTSLNAFTGLFSRLGSAGSAAFTRVGSAISKMASLSSRAFNRIKLGVAGLLVSILAVGGASSKMASDAAEVDNMFDVVFGAKAEEARSKLEAFGAQVGRSAVDLKTMAAQAQGLFVPLGVAREQATALSLSLTNLATDLGSFWNMADTDVMENLQSALIGNHEAVRKFGIMISEATLNEKLMKMGIKGGTEAASEQQKVLARLALMMEVTKDAQGDATRTADSHSNTMKAFWAVVKDLSITIGNALNPSVKAIVVKLKELVEWTKNNEETITRWGQKLAGVVNTALEYVGLFTAAVMNIDLAWQTLSLTVQEQYTRLVSPIKDFADTGTQYVMWFFNNFQDIAKSAMEYIWQLFKNTGSTIVEFWTNTWEAIKNMDPSKFKPDTSLMFKDLNKFDRVKPPDIQRRDKSQEDFSKAWEENAKKWDQIMGKHETTQKEAAKDAQMAMPDLQKMIEGAGRTNKKEKKLDIVSSAELFRKRLSEQFENKEGKDQVKLLEKQVQLAEDKKKQDEKDHKELVNAVKGQSPVGE